MLYEDIIGIRLLYPLGERRTSDEAIPLGSDKPVMQGSCSLAAALTDANARPVKLNLRTSNGLDKDIFGSHCRRSSLEPLILA